MHWCVGTSNIWILLVGMSLDMGRPSGWHLFPGRSCEEMNQGCGKGARNVGDDLRNTKRVKSVALGC